MQVCRLFSSSAPLLLFDPFTTLGGGLLSTIKLAQQLNASRRRFTTVTDLTVAIRALQVCICISTLFSSSFSLYGF
jgi:hypothetical protein